MDYLLLRKRVVPGTPPDGGAETLRRLWPVLPAASVVEYKSPSYPYRPGHLDRLWGYIHIYFAGQVALPRKRADGSALPTEAQEYPPVRAHGEVCAVLVVPRRTPSLDEDIAGMGLRWEDMGSGYWRVHGELFSLYVVEIDVVAPAEGDDLLYSVGHGELTTPDARHFWLELVGSKEAAMSTENLEGYDELMQKLLNTLPPEQRLAGLPPEQRLADLDRDHQALALPIEVLRLLPEAYLRSLSPEIQTELRKRLQTNGH